MLCTYLPTTDYLVPTGSYLDRDGRTPSLVTVYLVWSGLITALSPWRDPGKAQHVMGSRSLRVVDIKVMRYTYSLTADTICFTNK